MRALIALALAVFAASGVAQTKSFIPDRYAMEPVAMRLLQNDCPGAVAALNDGLRSGKPELLLQAGAMYEEGLCLKQDWSRAMHFYSLAHEAGHPNAAWRLAAGFATEAGGRDFAASLWWANVKKAGFLERCAVDAAALDDPARFVETLRTWPAGKLRACAYVAGVLSSVYGDLEFPRAGQFYGIDAVVDLKFVPAEGRLDVRTQEVNKRIRDGVVAGEWRLDRDSKRVQSLFERYVAELSERALKRYDRPSGIDPDWTISATLQFILD